MKIKVGACVLTSLGFIGLMTLSSCSEATEPSEQELALQSILNEVDERLGYVPIKPEPPASLLSGNTPEHILSPRDAVQHFANALTYGSITGDLTALENFRSTNPGCTNNQEQQLAFQREKFQDRVDNGKFLFVAKSSITIDTDYGAQSQSENDRLTLEDIYVIDATIHYPERELLDASTLTTIETDKSISQEVRLALETNESGEVKWCLIYSVD